MFFIIKRRWLTWPAGLFDSFVSVLYEYHEDRVGTDEDQEGACKSSVPRLQFHHHEYDHRTYERLEDIPGGNAACRKCRLRIVVRTGVRRYADSEVETTLTSSRQEDTAGGYRSGIYGSTADMMLMDIFRHDSWIRKGMQFEPHMQDKQEDVNTLLPDHSNI